jgi:hypothetical protein
MTMNVQLYVHAYSPRRGGAGRGARAAGPGARAACSVLSHVASRTWSRPAARLVLRASHGSRFTSLRVQDASLFRVPKHILPDLGPASPLAPCRVPSAEVRSGSGTTWDGPCAPRARVERGPRSRASTVRPWTLHRMRGCVASSISAPRRVQRNTARMLLSAIYVAHRRAMATPRPARGRDPRPSGTHERWAKRRGSAGASLTARD